MKLMLGVDPGTEHTGFCLYDLNEKKPIQYWTVNYHKGSSKKYYQTIYDTMNDAIKRCQKPIKVVFESFYGRANTREVIGIMKYVSVVVNNIPIDEITPSSVKKLTTGQGGRKVSKNQVIKAVNEKYSLDLKYADRHRADAIAIISSYISINCEKVVGVKWK